RRGEVTDLGPADLPGLLDAGSAGLDAPSSLLRRRLRPLSSLTSLRTHSIDPTTQGLLQTRHRRFHGALEALVEQPGHVSLQLLHVEGDPAALADSFRELSRARAHHRDLLLQPRHQGVS